MRARLLMTMFLTAYAVVAALTVPAAAKDSNAPSSAGDRWLPCEPWVMYHWIPFNERKFFKATGISRAELKRWIRDDDHHTVGQLVRRHHHRPDRIVEQLLRPWRNSVSDAHYNELLRRSENLMTQGHLAQHVFFHYFHNPVLAENARWIFGVSSGDYHRARLRGWTPREIAAQGGRSSASAERRAMLVMRRSQAAAVRNGETTRGQANNFLRAQHLWIDVWRKQDIHIDRKGAFPRGHRAPRGSELKRACTYMAGSNHVDGEHDGANYKPIAARSGRHVLYCDLLASEATQRRERS